MPRTPELTRLRSDLETEELLEMEDLLELEEDLLEAEVSASFRPVALPPPPRLPLLLPPVPRLPLPRYSSLPPIPVPPVTAPPPSSRTQPTEPPTRTRRVAAPASSPPPVSLPPPSSPSSTIPPATWSAPPEPPPLPPPTFSRYSVLAGVVVGALLFLVTWIAVVPARASSRDDGNIVAEGTRAPASLALETKPAPPPADEPIPVSALPVETPLQPPATPLVAPPQTPRVLPVAAGGTLNVNSIPIASVVVDGRPAGTTPLVGLRVSPGTHSVLVVHPELGRKAVRVSIGAGQRKAVAVRFDAPKPLGG